MFEAFLQIAEPIGTLLAMAIAVYASVRNPQIDMGERLAVFEKQLEKLEKEFVELKENHIKLLYSKIDDQSRQIADLSLKVMQLTTIIEERIPRTKKQ
jgi:hypothetical protein